MNPTRNRAGNSSIDSGRADQMAATIGIRYCSRKAAPTPIDLRYAPIETPSSKAPVSAAWVANRLNRWMSYNI